jgi:hypothetical protein
MVFVCLSYLPNRSFSAINLHRCFVSKRWNYRQCFLSMTRRKILLLRLPNGRDVAPKKSVHDAARAADDHHAKAWLS